jgi:hypothetical protein
VIDRWHPFDPSKGAFPLTFPLLTIRKKINWRDFEVGDIIEVYDSSTKWCESTVRQVNEGKICIHYNAWPDKWDGNSSHIDIIYPFFISRPSS